jgi:GNAT superfamily N-acetyltransferase
MPDAAVVRPMTIGDVEAVTALIVACEIDLDGESDVHAADLASNFERHGFDPAHDAVVVLHGNGVIAWADLYAERAEVDVHSDHRGRGIGGALLAWTERRAAELGMPRVRQTITDSNEAAVKLFTANGYAAAHTSWIVGISFEQEPPPAPVVPEAVTIRMFERGRDDPAAYRLIEDAFNEWPDRRPATFEEWEAYVLRHTAFAADLSPVAFEDGDLVGAVLSLDYPQGDEGWIYQVATRATHRNRGIARALLQTAFQAFHERGKKRCALSTDSRTGALTLYEHVGMTVRRSFTNYVKALSP